MKGKFKYVLATLLISAVALAACANDETNEKEQTNPDQAIEQEAAELETAAAEVEEEKEEEIIIPEESQQIDTFPWENNEDFLQAIKENDTEVLRSGFVTISKDLTDEELENISVAANKISGTVLQPGEVFSQNNTAGPYTLEEGYQEGDAYVGGQLIKSVGGGACNVATTLYNATIAGNLEIVERHNHSMPVSYVPYGQDAAVYEGYKDYQFKNDTDHPMLLWAERVDNLLYIGFYGNEVAPEVVWEHDILSETDAPTDYQTNPELPAGEENVLVEGMDGKVVDSILKVKHEDGKEEVKDLGRSSYNPLMHVIERSE